MCCFKQLFDCFSSHFFIALIHIYMRQKNGMLPCNIRRNHENTKNVSTLRNNYYVFSLCWGTEWEMGSIACYLLKMNMLYGFLSRTGSVILQKIQNSAHHLLIAVYFIMSQSFSNTKLNMRQFQRLDGDGIFIRAYTVAFVMYPKNG